MSKQTENMAAIARAVYPDGWWYAVGDRASDDRIDDLASSNRPAIFNLLETDANGQPTIQAKASGDDVSAHFNISLRPMLGRNGWGVWIWDDEINLTCLIGVWRSSRQSAIYRAACELLGLEVTEGGE